MIPLADPTPVNPEGIDRSMLPLTPHEFAWFTRFLREVSGIELKPGKEALVQSRLERRVREFGFSTYGEYFQLLAHPDTPGEAHTAVDLMTTNETYFFREPKHFDLLPELLPSRSDPARPIRIWSAACSTGEEAYSIALTLADCRPDLNWEILATDLSSRVVDTARQGLYPIESADRIPTRLLEHCRRGRGAYEGSMTIRNDLRTRITFRCLNLTGPLAGVGFFDVIFLRNVLIYFRPDTKRDVIQRLAACLRPGGTLVVGLAESLNGLDSGLVRCGPSVYTRPGA